MRQTVQHSYVQPLCRRGADDGTYSPWWSGRVNRRQSSSQLIPRTQVVVLVLVLSGLWWWRRWQRRRWQLISNHIPRTRVVLLLVVWYCWCWHSADSHCCVTLAASSRRMRSGSASTDCSSESGRDCRRPEDHHSQALQAHVLLRLPLLPEFFFQDLKSISQALHNAAAVMHRSRRRVVVRASMLLPRG